MHREREGERPTSMRQRVDMGEEGNCTSCPSMIAEAYLRQMRKESQEKGKMMMGRSKRE